MKTPGELLTDEFFERVLEDIPRMLPPPVQAHRGDASAAFSHRAAYRRLLRERILEQLAK